MPNPADENATADTDLNAETTATTCQSIDRSSSVEAETPVVTISAAPEEASSPQSIDAAAQDYVN
jgi:hypothetical protein